MLCSNAAVFTIQAAEGGPSTEVKEDLKKLLDKSLDGKKPSEVGSVFATWPSSCCFAHVVQTKSRQQCSHCTQRKLCAPCGRCGKTWYCSAACQVA
jgi:hypothetical protein